MSGWLKRYGTSLAFFAIALMKLIFVLGQNEPVRFVQWTEIATFTGVGVLWIYAGRALAARRKS